MTKRSIGMLGALILSLATIWGRQTGNSTSVQALESSSASTSAAQTASPDPKAVTWEYKMLSGDLSQVVRGRSANDRNGILVYRLEEEINKLAVQGYVVESFQAYTSVSGGSSGSGTPFSFSSAATVIVLLKRIRK